MHTVPTAFLLPLAFFGFVESSAFAGTVPTPAEASSYTRYTQHQDVAPFLDAIAKASPHVRAAIIGHTGEARDFAPAPLYLVVVTSEGVSTPEALNRTKPTVFVIGAQHGNEQSGKEAALTLIRDLAVGSLQPLLKQVNVLVVPQANPYGNFVNKRPNEQGLDLNRDHVKLEAPETRAIHAAFRAWMPEVSIDVHEKGDDYYRVNTGCVTNANIAPAIKAFSHDTIFRELAETVAAGGSTWHEYLVTEAMGSQGAAGAPEPKDEKDRPTLTRPSTTDLNDGRNSLGIYETISFIQEGASRHDIPTLKDRTAYQLLGITALVQSVARHADQVIAVVSASRSALLANAKAPASGNVVHLRMVHARDPKDPELTITGFEEAPPGTEGQAANPKLVTRVIKNWFPAVEPTVSVPRAFGYIVPAAHDDVVRALVAHGISVLRLAADVAVDAEQYRVDDVTPASEDYVAPETIAVTRMPVRVTARKGDYYVSGAQAAANLIPNLLEPQAEFGFIRYRAFKLVPEKGALYPLLRVEKPLTVPVDLEK